MLSQAKFAELKAIGNLPSPKGVALRVIELTRKDDATNQEIAHAIKSDPALSSRIIKVANTRVAHQTRPIVSIVEAVTVLGFNTVRQLALSLSILDNSRSGACQQFDYQNFWTHSLLMAITAQNLVLHSGIGSNEEVFILGLLGQIGSLAMASVYQQEYARILSSFASNQDVVLVDLERAEFGFDHNQLTQALLAEWGLPSVFQEVALHHEEPAHSSFVEGCRSWHLLHVLHLANLFARVCLTHEPLRRKMVPKLILTATRMGIELDALAMLGDKSVREWQEWGQLCDIHSVNFPRFAELLEAVPLVPDMLEVAEELPGSASTFYKLRILLVDDDNSILLLLKTLLEKIGHTVATASNGMEGLGMIDSFKPQLIITDWMMPEMDGIEFCKVLRQNAAWRNIYVFIMTAQEGMDRLVEAFEAGANDYLNKPVSPKILVARLRAGQRVVQLQEEIEFDRQQLRKFAGELATFNHRLRKSEVSMRAILENSPYMTWLKDSDGRYVNVNMAYVNHARMKGSEQIIGKTDFDLWTKEVALKYRADDAEVMATRQQKRIEASMRDGNKMRWIETFKTPVIDSNGKVLGTTGFARDISDRKAADEQIRNLAFYDELTQLPNRRLLNDRLGQTMATSKRSGRYGALIFLDMDNFKPLNDTHGHGVGDLLLIEVAHRLVSCVREVDTVTRFGGDEFVVMLSELDEDKNESTAQAKIVADKIRVALSEQYVLEVHPEGKSKSTVVHHCTSSIGVALFINHQASTEDIIKWADIAMYQAKEAGRNLIRFYN